MNGSAEQALWKLESALNRVSGHVKATNYGLRLAAKRIGDLTAKGGGAIAAASSSSAEEMEELTHSLGQAGEVVSEVVLLAYGDHFRAFLGEALGLDVPPTLPESKAAVEQLAGVPGALDKVSEMFPIGLALAGGLLRNGYIDSQTLKALGVEEFELSFPYGKVKLFREGDKPTLDELHLEQIAQGYLEAAKAVNIRLQTA